MRPFDNVLDAAQRTGHRVKDRKSDSALVQCGALSHPDNTPSLSVSEGADGGVIVHCHARNCSPEEIVTGFGLGMSDLFPAKGEPAAKPQIAATYDYTDEAGTLIYQVVRMTPKSFRQRQPDGGGWTWDLKGIDRLPYHLPQLTEAVSAGEIVVIVEGEKDAEALADLGFVATCNSGGAGKWPESFAQYFNGATVVILPDHDDPGLSHARQVGASLSSAVSSLKVLELPGLAPKGDCSDWIAKGGTREELERLIAKAPTFTEWDKAPEIPAETELTRAGIMSIEWADLWSTDSPDEDWLIDQILPRGRQAGIFCAAGLGKSLLALDIAAALATGRSVLGAEPREALSVCYFDLEMTPDDLRERLEDLGYGPEVDLSKFHYYQIPTLPALDTPEGGQIMAAILDQDRPALVVLDTMARIVQGDENSADTYRDFYRYTGSMLKARGVALLRLDHAGKDPAKGQRGSSSKGDDLDLIWRLGVTGDTVTLTRLKSRVAYVPAEVSLTRELEPSLRHVLTPTGFPAGTGEVVTLLDNLGVAVDATAAIAMRTLKNAGFGRRKTLVLAAIKTRRNRCYVTGNQDLVTYDNNLGTTREPPKNHDTEPQVRVDILVPGTSGNHGNQGFGVGSRFPLLKEGTGDTGPEPGNFPQCGRCQEELISGDYECACVRGEIF